MADIFSKFRVGSTQHSNTNAYLCALLSYYSYDKNPDGTDRIAGSGSFISKLGGFLAGISESDPVNTHLVSTGGTEVVVVDNSEAIWITFRGTDGIDEWLNPKLDVHGLSAGRHANIASALKDTPSSWGPGRVHEGFFNALSSVYTELKEYVVDLIADNDRPVFITGHSRGGALATLCAYRFQAAGGIPVSGVYTFAAPRVGDAQAFVSNYTLTGLNHGMNLASTTFRWIHAHDPAPSVPMVSEKVMKTTLTAFKIANAALIGPLLAVPPGVPLAAGVTMVNAAASAVAFNALYRHTVKKGERYSHVGEARHLLPDGTTDSSLSRDYSAHSLEAVFEGNLIGNTFTNWLADHSMENYLIGMHSRLSSAARTDTNSPDFLVRADVPTPTANWFPVTMSFPQATIDLTANRRRRRRRPTP